MKSSGEPWALLFIWTSGCETFASVPWSFLTRPDTKSHRQGPPAGSENSPFFIF
jgi:hypothetical protein